MYDFLNCERSPYHASHEWAVMLFLRELAMVLRGGGRRAVLEQGWSAKREGVSASRL